MTKRELNRDVKRLAKFVSNYVGTTDEKTEEYIKAEAKRLYQADKEMTYLNKDSIKVLLRLNLRYRFVQLHSFGLFIEL